jgi:hypothetical protein
MSVMSIDAIIGTKFVCVERLVFPLLGHLIGSLDLIEVKLVAPSVWGWVLGSVGSMVMIVLLPFPLVVPRVLIGRKGSILLRIHLSLWRRCRLTNMGRGHTC